MSTVSNFKWIVGEDFRLQLVYKEGDTAATAKPVDLSAGYALRMDIVEGATVLYTFSSEDNAGTLRHGRNGEPNIEFFLPRSLTLSGGALYNKGPLQYDVFLRNTTTNRQFKILRGSISFEKSNTLWA